MVIMGVSGCGKTTIGKQLGKRLELPFYDADDFHPINNIRKMKDGIPLEDDDRLPWLNKLASKLTKWESQNGAVLACSALKEYYRKILAREVNEINWIFLKGSYHTIMNRIKKRKDHYMPPALLKSQFEFLEVPKYAFKVEIEKSPEEIVNSIIKYLQYG